MPNFAGGMTTVMVGFFIVSSPSLNTPFSGLGGSMAIYDSARRGRGVRCEVPDKQVLGGPIAFCT